MTLGPLQQGGVGGVAGEGQGLVSGATRQDCDSHKAWEVLGSQEVDSEGNVPVIT